MAFNLLMGKFQLMKNVFTLFHAVNINAHFLEAVIVLGY